MPLKTITNPQTGQTIQVAENALSPNTLNQYGGGVPQTPMPAPVPPAPPMPMQSAMPTPIAPPMPSSRPVPMPTPVPTPTPQESMMNQPNSVEIAPDVPEKKAPVFASGVQPTNQGGFNMNKPKPVNSFGLNKAYDDEKKAINEIGEARAEKELATGKVYEESRQQMESIDANRKEMTQAYNQEFEKYKTNIEALSAEASQGVDPRKYWKNKSSFGKVGAALSIMAGTMGTAINQAAGGRMNGNAALDIIMSQIDQDIQAQRDNIAQKGREAGTQQNLYQMAMSKFGNESAAMEAAKSSLIDQTKMRLVEMTSNASSKEAQAAAKQSIAALDQKKAESNIKLDQFAKAQANKSAQGIDRYIAGKGMAYSKESANKARSFSTDHEVMNSTLNRLIELRKEYGAKKLPSEAKTELNNLSATLQTLANKAVFELGALSGDDLKMIKKAIPDGSDVGFVLKSYETFQKTLNTKADSFYKNNIIGWQGFPEDDQRFKPK